MTIEWLLGLMLVGVPVLMTSGYALKTDWEKSKCAYQTFRQARTKLIATRSSVSEFQLCGEVRESLKLAALEDLDLDKGAIGIGDYASEVSQFRERFSSWRSSLLPSASSSSAVASAPTLTDK